MKFKKFKKENKKYPNKTVKMKKLSDFMMKIGLFSYEKFKWKKDSLKISYIIN